jgi:branched-chain amino acid transport system substrate-binding protein
MAVAEFRRQPSPVGIIGWPSPVESSTLATSAARAGLPYVDLSPVIPPESPEASGEESSIASDRSQAEALGRLVRASPSKTICTATTAEPRGDALIRWVHAVLGLDGIRIAAAHVVAPQQTDYSTLVNELGAAGCQLLVWAGGGTEGGVIATEAATAGIDMRMIGVDPLIGDPFIAIAGSAGEKTMATCTCVDLSTSSRLVAQKFVQDYQSAYGSPPGVYSAEGWDAAQRFLAAVNSGATTAISIESYLANHRTFEGLAGQTFLR